MMPLLRWGGERARQGGDPGTAEPEGRGPPPEMTEAALSAAEEQLLRELTERARAGGLKLTGEGGLLGKLTKMAIEGALKGEMDGHLGYALTAASRMSACQVVPFMVHPSPPASANRKSLPHEEELSDNYQNSSRSWSAAADP